MTPEELLDAPIKHAPNGSRIRDHDCEFSDLLCWPQDSGVLVHGGRCPECGDVFVRTGIIGGFIVPSAEYEEHRRSRATVRPLDYRR